MRQSAGHQEFFSLEEARGASILRLRSNDGTNRLSRARVLALTTIIQKLSGRVQPLVLAGNAKFFSVGADLEEIASLTASQAYEFSRMGQFLMNAVEEFPRPIYAAISGYCMGGGLDLALACHRRIASPGAIFGHRGAAFGLITGWSGTQRLPRIIGKALALQMFIEGERVNAHRALGLGLIDAIADDPLAKSLQTIENAGSEWR